MDLKQKIRQRKHRRGTTAELAAQLAPLEEQNPRGAQRQDVDAVSGVHQETGAIVVDYDAPLKETDSGSERLILGLEPVVFVIVLIMLGFTAFITWQITQLPTD